MDTGKALTSLSKVYSSIGVQPLQLTASTEDPARPSKIPTDRNNLKLRCSILYDTCIVVASVQYDRLSNTDTGARTVSSFTIATISIVDV